MDVKLTVVIPTLGRPSLKRTLASCADADEIIVVLDQARGAVDLDFPLPPNARYRSGRWGVTGGHAGRVAGIEMATGTHLAFMDDDDVYNPGAIELMKQAACDVPVIFRMSHYAHGILWRDRVVEFGNVSTQMYVVPNDPDRLGKWTEHRPGWREPGGDYTFIAECVENMGGPVWREEITSTIRPDSHKPTIAIVTPWHNHLELVDDYLQAVDRRRPSDELIIVDCGSTPPLPFADIRSEENLGFVGGSNLGLAHATADAVVFLNNDVQLTRDHWLEELRDEIAPGVILGPLRFDRHADFDGQRLPYIDGWCFAGMRDDLLNLGGFDTRLKEPAYYSDNLLSLEARAAGMSLLDVRVGLRHIKNVTAGGQFDPAVQKATKANRAIYEARARELLATTID